MPTFEVRTTREVYPAVVERGALSQLAAFLPPNHGKVFVVTTEDVFQHQGERLRRALSGTPHEKILLPGGEQRKRLDPLEAAAGEMLRLGGDRASIVIAFGGGIVTDMGGFLAAIFMRGIPVIQVPTTLLAQVDAAVGGKTGVNLAGGKNLIGAFHQPLAVIIDPAVLNTLPEREYRAGLYEIIKAGIIRDLPLFRFLQQQAASVLAREPAAVDRIIASAVKMKAEVVSEDEKESDLRRILNFGHTIGHAVEAETAYTRFLHGEAVAFGMCAATYLAQITGHLSAEDTVEILQCIESYGPIPPVGGMQPEKLLARLGSDKKTIRGKVHFVLPTGIGAVKVVSGIEDAMVLDAIRRALA